MVLGGFFNRCFHCVISAQNEQAASSVVPLVVNLGCDYSYVNGLSVCRPCVH